jgi:CRISPR-associated exonuclease Cas4
VFCEDEYLQLSGLQHFLFCRRQWALIHIENLWADNERTVSGALLHQRTHNENLTKRRANIITARAMRVYSPVLGISGTCDVLEFHKDQKGVSIHGWEGRWRPFPVEYKRGEPKPENYDKAQLCAQAMCLEYMLCCTIESGALFYGKSRRRQPVEFTDKLRSEVSSALSEMHMLIKRGHTPRSKPSKSCNACSLKEQCLPALSKRQSVKAYLEEHNESSAEHPICHE